jgi:tetratricopeptide (TPR) repeat protein
MTGRNSTRTIPVIGKIQLGTGRNRLALVLLAPPAFLALLEIILRVAGIGHPTDFFIRARNGRDFIPNENFGRAFHCPEKPDPFVLPAIKPADNIRIFVLGESAAYGSPDSAFGVSRILEEMLRDKFPGRKIDVFNAAMMGINSFAINRIAHECAAHDADLLVVYAGNNELSGSYGADTFAARLPPVLSRWYIHASVTVRSSRTGQLIASLAHSDSRRDVQDETFFRNHRFDPASRRCATVRDNFRANLRDLCDLAQNGRVKILLSSVAINLRDCPPFGSLHKENLSAADAAAWSNSYLHGIELAKNAKTHEAIAEFTKAMRLDGGFAELHFRAGRCFEAAQNFRLAEREFRTAADCDAIPFRADSQLNRIIRDEATRGVRGVTFVDAATIIAAADAAQNRIPGSALFHDHVHFRFHGNCELANALFSSIASAIATSVEYVSAASPPSESELALRLAYTHWDEWKLQDSMLNLFSHPPCSLQMDADARVREARERRDKLKNSFGFDAQVAAVRVYEDAIARSPDDWHLHANFAELLDAIHQPAAAVAQWQLVADRFPDHAIFGRMLNADRALVGPPLAIPDAMALLHLIFGNTFQSDLRLPEAIEEYHRALRCAPNSVEANNNLGGAFLRQGKLDDAIAQFQKTIALKPDHAGAHLNLGIAFASQRRFNEAVAHLRRAVELHVQSPFAATKLAMILAAADDATLRNGPEAVRIAESIVAATGRKFPAALEALAAAYAECGRFDDAIRTAQEELKLSADAGANQLVVELARRIELFTAKKPFRIP